MTREDTPLDKERLDGRATRSAASVTLRPAML